MFFSINSRHFFYYKFILLIPVIMLLPEFGCEPVSVPSAPNDFDKIAAVNGFVVPDSVVAGELFTVQVNYQIACNEQFVKLRLDNALPRYTFTPIVHKFPDQACSSPSIITTTAETLRIYDAGMDTIIVSGQDFAVAQPTVTLTGINRPQLFRFHFLFRNSQGGLANYSSTFQRLDGAVVKSFHTDTLGYWDTTFSDALSKIQYKIGGLLRFEAAKGVKENGEVVIQ
jgi:hypothetical protein